MEGGIEPVEEQQLRQVQRDRLGVVDRAAAEAGASELTWWFARGPLRRGL